MQYGENLGAEGEAGREGKWSRGTGRRVNPGRVCTHVDSDALPSKSTRSADTVYVIFTIPVCEATVR